MAKTQTRRWDAAEHLEIKEDMAAYLEAVLEACAASGRALARGPQAPVKSTITA